MEWGEAGLLAQLVFSFAPSGAFARNGAKLTRGGPNSAIAAQLIVLVMMIAIAVPAETRRLAGQLNLTPKRPPVSVASVSFVSRTYGRMSKPRCNASRGNASEFIVTMYWKPEASARSAPS
jgi:hypothetical protein